MLSKNVWKLIDFLFAVAIFLALAVGIRTLIYFFIGLDNERTFRPDLNILWGIIIFIILFRFIAKKFLK
jgi:hypothetical protein